MTVSTENHTDWDYEAVVEQRDALLAENQRLRDALEAMRELASVSTDGDGWYAEQAGLDADAIFTQAREALAGDAE